MNIYQQTQKVIVTDVPRWGTVFCRGTVWDALFPAEQARILQLLIERVEVHPDRLDLQLRVDGLQTLVTDLRAGKPERKAA